jgi:glycine hydroxymethyltransferase
MDEVVRHVDDDATIERVAAEVKEACSGFPPPGIRV